MDGLGTQASPFLVATPQDLQDVNNDLGDTGDITYYRQIADLDMDGFSFTRIGPSTYIDYDGNGYIIENLSATATGVVGMISSTSEEGALRNIKLVNPTMVLDGNFDNIGSLAGIVRCFVSGCSVIGGSVTAEDTFYVGGLIGRLSLEGTVENCYAITTVNANDSSFVGGLIGNVANDSTCRKSWCATTLNTNEGSSNVNGITRRGTGTDEDLFWNTDIYPTSDQGTGKTTAELQTLATFTDVENTTGLSEAYDMVRAADFDGSQTWVMPDTDESDYPELGAFIVVPEYAKVTVYSDQSQSTPAEGVTVELHQYDSETGFTTSQATLIDVGVTDANGVYESEAVAFDPDKIHRWIVSDKNYVDNAWVRTKADSGFTSENLDNSAPA